MGSAAIDLAYTACGRFDAYYEGSINAWDVSAGIIIVREAGGIVTGLYGEEEPCFTGHILAANPSIHSALRLIIVQKMTKIIGCTEIIDLHHFF
ncbi:MAG: hypothetical protein IPF93_15700 [Saprospiraceae bacterium]|nr:hypothetical protein [Saprospiraceae bacterium]